MALTRQLVSVLPNNTLGNAASGSYKGDLTSLTDNAEHLSISTDGRYVVFETLATNFSGVVTDNNSKSDIYLKDMQTGALTLVSTKTDGSLLQSALDSISPDISDNGQYAVFQAAKTIYWKNTVTGELVEASASYRTETALHTVLGVNPSMSADGLKVVFDTNKETSINVFNNIDDGNSQVFLRDMSDLNAKSVMLSKTAAGVEGNSHSNHANISDNGNFVVFESSASNLFDEDNNGKRDILIKNLSNAEISVVSASATGVLSNGTSENPMISADGRYVVFESYASNLIDGQTVASPNSNPGEKQQIYRKDMQTGEVALVSINADGLINNQNSFKPIISADGRYVVFYDGSGTNLSTNPSTLYLKDMETGALTSLDPVYTSMFNTQQIAPMAQYAFSADGSYIVLATDQTVFNSPSGADATLNVFRYELSGLTGGTSSIESSVNYTLGANETNLTLTGTGNIKGAGNDSANELTGNSGKNTLTGKAGADTLDGGAGVDILIGGAGNDTYTVDIVQTGSGAKAIAKLQDTVTETKSTVTVDSGIDTLILRGSLTLTKATTISVPSYIEIFDASLTGSTLLNLKGGAEANTITGNDAANQIEGLAGADSILGGAGNDTLIGGAGNDTLEGGEGDDVYVYDFKLNTEKTALVLEDSYTETGEGSDTFKFNLVGKAPAIISPINIYLSAYTDIENIDLSGTASVKNLNIVGTAADNLLIGNKASNTLTGNAGNDTLDGGGGADVLIGGDGNDTYVIDVAGDVITESGDDASDKVQSLIANYTLGSGIENLEIVGKIAGNSIGNELNNKMTGNGKANKLSGEVGDDTFIGGLGNDTLTGGEGNDVFVFNTALKANIDTITDFATGDKIHLDDAIFSSLGLGMLTENNFVDAPKAKAAAVDDYIIYDSSSGKLYYDADGIGKGAMVQFATIFSSPTTKADLSYTDFLVI